MTKKRINLLGIMIDAEYKDFKLYHIHEGWGKSIQDSTSSSQFTSDNSWVEGLEDIIGYLSVLPESHANPQFVILYDVSCPNKEAHIKKLLAEINKIKKDDLLPALISIGHEQSPWSKDIADQVCIIQEIANNGAPNDMLKNMIGRELKEIKTQTTLVFLEKINQVQTSYFDQIKTYLTFEDWNNWQNALVTGEQSRKRLNKIKSEIEADSLLSKNDRTKLLVMLTSFNKEMLHRENEIRTKMEGVLGETPDTAETHSSSMMNISMMVLGGFMAAAGIAAVAIAFTVLNAATFGIAGLVVAGIGLATALSGVGLFAKGAYKNKNTTCDISLENSNNIVPISL